MSPGAPDAPTSPHCHAVALLGLGVLGHLLVLVDQSFQPPRRALPCRSASATFSSTSLSLVGASPGLALWTLRYSAPGTRANPSGSRDAGRSLVGASPGLTLWTLVLGPGHPGQPSWGSRDAGFPFLALARLSVPSVRSSYLFGGEVAIFLGGAESFCRPSTRANPLRLPRCWFPFSRCGTPQRATRSRPPSSSQTASAAGWRAVATL